MPQEWPSQRLLLYRTAPSATSRTTFAFRGRCYGRKRTDGGDDAGGDGRGSLCVGVAGGGRIAVSPVVTGLLRRRGR